jgi:peroxiredoxin
LQALQKKYGAKGFTVVSVSSDDSDQEASAFAKEIKATFPVIRDSEGKIYTAFKSEAVPANLVIDRKGKIVYSKDSAADLKGLEAAIVKALK